MTKKKSSIKPPKGDIKTITVSMSTDFKNTTLIKKTAYWQHIFNNTVIADDSIVIQQTDALNT